jgi:hypothetical protein
VDSRDECVKAQKLQSIAVSSIQLIEERNGRVHAPAVTASEQAPVSPEGSTRARMKLPPAPDVFMSIDLTGDGDVPEPDSTVSVTLNSEY